LRLNLLLYKLAFLRGDGGEMKKQVEAAAGQPGNEDLLLAAQAETEAYYGGPHQSARIHPAGNRLG
jgi:hypothetical protein